MDLKILEKGLKSKDERVEKILSLDMEEGTVTGPGENYGSSIRRMKCVIQLKTGEIVHKPLLIKRLPDSDFEAMYIAAYDCFRTEIEAYSKVIPPMEELAKQYDIEIVWCDSYFYSHYDQIILEDLTIEGYTTLQSKGPFDIQHTKLILKSLAKLHALSAVQIHRKLLSPKALQPDVYARQNDLVNNVILSGLKTLTKVIKKYWRDPGWEEVSERYDGLINTVGQDIHDIWHERSDQLLVFNHGDCWIRNILFKYDCNGNPISLRFIDYQEGHFNTYAWDLIFFLYTSVNREVCEENFDDLLNDYRNALLATFKKLKYIPSNFPSLDDIKKELWRLRVYKIVAIGFSPYCLAQNENVISLTTIVSKEEEDEKKRIQCFCSSEVANHIRHFLRTHYEEIIS